MLTITVQNKWTKVKHSFKWTPGDTLLLNRREWIVGISGCDKDMRSVLAVLQECQW